MKKLLQVISPSVYVLTLLLIGISTQTSYAENIEDNCAEEDVFSIYCPATEWLDCTDEIWDLSWLPNAYVHDYSGTRDAGKPTVKYYLNHCNVGYIVRSWAVADYNNVWHKCSQTIYVGGNSFNYSSIKWPKNIELTGCNPNTDPDWLPSGKNKPTWSNYGATCAQIGINYHDNVYVYGPGCYEIIRTWKIVDCCIFDPFYNRGIWTYNQRIKVTSTVSSPNVWVPYDITEMTYGCEKKQVNIPKVEVKDGCDDQYLITNNSPYASSDGADASGKYPVGTTQVRFMVKYNCWETKFYYVNVTVTDDSHPVPYCFYGLSMPFMGVDTDDDGIIDDGMAEIWASDFDAGSYHPCRSDEKLRFSFSSDPYDNVRIFSCEDVGEKEVNIWVTDENGKQDYCTTVVDLQNNGAEIPNCDPISDAIISGKITSLFGNAEELTMSVNSTFEGMEFDTSYSIEIRSILMDSSVATNGDVTHYFGMEEVEIPTYDTTNINKNFELAISEGDYALEYLDLNEDYTLSIRKDNPSFISIDSMDVKFLQNYLDDKVAMNMYQKMAADVNHDMMINADDLSLLQSYVKGSIDESAIDLSWKSFDPTYPMTETEATDLNPYPIYRMVEINNRNAFGIDLVVFQMGDLTDQTDASSSADNQSVVQRDLKDFSLKSLSPNPFSKNTNFVIDNNKTQDVSLEIFDMNGKSIYRRTQLLEKGIQTLQLEAEYLSNAGIYFYILRTDAVSKQGKLIHIK